MQQLEFTKRFRKEVKKWERSGQSMEPFYEFVAAVKATWPPPAQYEAHLLTGDLEGIWDIHLRQNWVILLRFDAGVVRFLRMGTHADLGL
ncbi:type II toxin-antitoxin system mRNA interferase toxin, RelE/StbE family [Candidatus Peregrinibacteria bacterium]|nr:type II toxin-antitoxin system mRNA interferase toxin, RelE/StbE family [Candidatus Peregrinibacteria bacterium]MBI3816879.1 type II toxin-antitoxin system mRNA interferase toxin, RelE/StbE family [Candidatus Peregrinibacteria bacterium]